jgi:hypothetical protein
MKFEDQVRIKQANIFGLVFLGKVELSLPMTQEKQRGKGDKNISCARVLNNILDYSLKAKVGQFLIFFTFIVYTLNLLEFLKNNTLFKAIINLKELWEIVLF